MVGTSWIGLIVPKGQDVDAAIAEVKEAIEPLDGVIAQRLGDTFGAFFDLQDQLRILLNALLLLAVAVAALGVVNTMIINVTERRREIALLRAVGATQRQVRRAIVAEATILGLMAAIISAVVGAAMLGIFVLEMLPGGFTSVGLRVNWEMIKLALSPALRDLGIAAALSLIFGPLVAALAAYYPARQAAAMDVVEAARSERVTLKQKEKVRRTSKVRRTFRTSLTWTMAWRNLEQHRTRTALSVMAVALGVAMVIAAKVIVASLSTHVAENIGSIYNDISDFGLTVVGIVILVAAGFLIFNAFAMAVTQRRRQIGALRSLGMTRRQVMYMVLVEAVLVGGSGTMLGLIAGPLLGRGEVALLKAVGRLFDVTLGVFGKPGAPPTSSLVTAVVMGLGITLVSTLFPARQATGVSPLAALRAQTATDARVGRPGFIALLTKRAWVLGLLIIAALVAYLIIAPPSAWVTTPWDSILLVSFILVWLIALALITPALVGAVARLVRGLLVRGWGATGRIAADNLQRSRKRVTLTIFTLVVGLGTIVSVTGVTTFLFKVLMHEIMDSAL